MSATRATPTSTGSKLLFVAFLGLLVMAAKAGQAQTETVLYRFCSQPNCVDGYLPSGTPVLDTTGNVYGTTRNGGAYQYGTLFEIGPDAVETVRHNFMQGFGSYPEGSLLTDEKGNLYGTTIGSSYVGLLGSRFFGSVFKLELRSYRFLHRFSAENLEDGAQPSAGLVMDAQGNVYGAAGAGGVNGCFTGYGCGAIFELSPKGTETVLYNFAGGTDDGENPNGSLIFDSAGNLYGTTLHGGIDNPYCVAACGTVFELTPSGTETVLYRFKGGPDGGNPIAGLVMDAQGNLYGTTLFGGTSEGNGWGTVFEITAGGEEIVLYRFTGEMDGGEPYGGLLLDYQGNLYGTTFYGGGTSCYENAGCGTVFKLSPTGVETVLYRFQGGADGEGPYGVVADAQGNLYGVTAFGGNYNIACSQRGCGVAFKVTP